MRKAHKVIRPIALATAGLSAWAGTPAARGDFIFYMSSPTTYVSDGIDYSIYVVSAQNTGTHGTGTELLGANVIINTPGAFNSPLGALGIDVEKLGAKYEANVDGTVDSNNNNYDPGGPAVFGDGYGGTFVGIGDSGPFTSDLADNGITAQGGTQAVYINSQTADYTPFNNVRATYSGAISKLDPQFENVGPSVNLGELDNGTIHSLQVEELADTGAGAPLANFTGGVPFAQIAVPTGTAFTIQGEIGGDSGNPYVFAFSSTSPPVNSSTSGLSISLTSSLPGTAAPIVPVISGGIGVQTRSTADISGIKGYAEIEGFAPDTFPTYFGVKAVSATTTPIGSSEFSQLIVDLNVALSKTNPGAVAETLRGSQGTLLADAGCNIEFFFPAGSFNSTQPEFFSFDLSYYEPSETNFQPVVFSSFSAITVPEPVCIGWVMCGIGLLRRRSRIIAARTSVD